MTSSFEMGRAHNVRFMRGGGGAPPADPLVTDAQAAERDCEDWRQRALEMARNYEEAEERKMAAFDRIQCLEYALEQIRDGIFSGNQAAEWARKALAP